MAADMSRRGFLSTSVAASAAVALSARGLAAAADDAGKWIDAHSHIWTPDVERYPLAEGATKADLAPPSFTADQLLELAQPAGVGRVVLIAHHKYYAYNNTYMIDEAARRPQVFRIVGLVDDSRPHPDATMRRLLDQRVTGFRITPWIRGAGWLDTPGMQAMWKCGAETRQAMCCLIDAENLDEVDAMCGKYRDTPVVIDHFARIGVDGMIRDEHVDKLCRLARHPQVRVKISAYYALGRKQPPHDELKPMTRRLFDAYGPQRLMWASDCPYQLAAPNTYDTSLAFIQQGLDFLSAGDRQWLLRGTAENVYFFQ
jgi:predicted TIM-barrel fold metal-dependent hydrolase